MASLPEAPRAESKIMGKQKHSRIAQLVESLHAKTEPATKTLPLRKTLVPIIMALVVVITFAPACPAKATPANGTDAADVQAMVASMSKDDKVSQLIMPAMRSWNGSAATSLSSAPGLEQALAAHHYGGIILFGSNIATTEQTTHLVAALQNNQIGSGGLPYFIACDQEGGEVSRLGMGTRGTGSMAIAATGAHAVTNARSTGQIFGQELSALGINMDFGPCADVISDPADPGASTRIFSDDGNEAGALSKAFAEGLAQSNVIATYKHFPGAGDGSDYPTAITIDSNALQAEGLTSFGAALSRGEEQGEAQSGAQGNSDGDLQGNSDDGTQGDAVMVSACTFPNVDDVQTLGDGITQGHFPAAMSQHIVRDLLRNQLGFNGVVVTDALEMDQFKVDPQTGVRLVPGSVESTAYQENVAKACLNAGCDILLIPADLTSSSAASQLDAYVAGIVAKADAGEISWDTIDAAVTRILTLKQRHAILSMQHADEDQINQQVRAAVATVGSDEHYTEERNIATQAVTLLKNGEGKSSEGATDQGQSNEGATGQVQSDQAADEQPLPLPTSGKITIMCRRPKEAASVLGTLRQMKSDGTLPANAQLSDLTSGSTEGDVASGLSIVVGSYTSNGANTYGGSLREAVKTSSRVVCLSSCDANTKSGMGYLASIQNSDPGVQAITQALSDAHSSGGKFVLLSDSLPYDVARYQDADAIMLCYLSAGSEIDPTSRKDGLANTTSPNANIPAAILTAFGVNEPTGSLPVSIHALQQSDGRWVFTSDELYARGYGIDFNNTQVEGTNWADELNDANTDTTGTPSNETDNSTSESAQNDSPSTAKKNTPLANPMAIAIVCVGVVVCAAATVRVVRTRRQNEQTGHSKPGKHAR